MTNYYRITIQGHLDGGWASWFDGLAISNQMDGTAILSGHISDQAALHGVLMKIRDLGLPLLAVQRAAGSQQGDNEVEESELE